MNSTTATIITLVFCLLAIFYVSSLMLYKSSKDMNKLKQDAVSMGIAYYSVNQSNGKDPEIVFNWKYKEIYKTNFVLFPSNLFENTWIKDPQKCQSLDELFVRTELQWSLWFVNDVDYWHEQKGIGKWRRDDSDARIDFLLKDVSVETRPVLVIKMPKNDIVPEIYITREMMRLLGQAINSSNKDMWTSRVYNAIVKKFPTFMEKQ